MIEHTVVVNVSGNGDVWLQDPKGVKFLYTLTQLRAYAKFDHQLRRHDVFDIDTYPISGGYFEFQALWAIKQNCEFQFFTYDVSTSIKQPHGRSIPIDEFAPLPCAPSISSEFKEVIAERAAHAALAREAHRMEILTVEHAHRKWKRQQKAALGTYLSPYSAPSSTGPSRPASRGRSSKSISRAGTPYRSTYERSASQALTPPTLVAVREAEATQDRSVEETPSTLIVGTPETLVIQAEPMQEN
ncbi:hypothetical protein OBBRIDRAFT_840127 [Obba rivulosa]|uniref:Uncharacterized protein n=1 Tax=Obba rivulosa TaxID=1052685 RepID=A0A8E2AG68_9APHY|nr:hypothetical protein OBBRIDRAFT_840127 [Obba rivulosa]